ncbi:MAG: hypothetical protein L0Y79_06435 [Chlorobi bacterium]|nr:hypothetical protein [Chlorobiota bacterium]MCI0716079.1 hypothetical protein [Chlorobiota bacterium]
MKFKLSEIKFAHIIIILLTLISQRIVYNRIIYPIPETRIGFEESILSGGANEPYQYRVMKPLLGKFFGVLIRPVVKDKIRNHLAAYKILSYIVFFLLYFLFYIFLRNFYTEITSVCGLLLLQIVIPLSITSHWQEGDFITAVFYLAGLVLIFKNKEHFLPLVVLIGVLNRDQIIYVAVFYIAYLLEQKKLFKAKSIIIIASCAIAFGISYYGLRLYFGFKPDYATVVFNIQSNITHWTSISRLWAEQVLIFVILCIIVYKKSRLFFKYSFLSLILYTILFFLKGIMGELAKYLPAYIIMISMGIQLFNKEFTIDNKLHKAGGN